MTDQHVSIGVTLIDEISDHCILIYWESAEITQSSNDMGIIVSKYFNGVY